MSDGEMQIAEGLQTYISLEHTIFFQGGSHCCSHAGPSCRYQMCIHLCSLYIPEWTDIAGLTPCAESKKFQKNLKKEVKSLEKRQKLREAGSEFAMHDFTSFALFSYL